MRYALPLAAAALAAPTAAPGDTLHCLGLSPAFTMALDGAQARFDYLGDGVFDLDPALSLPEDGMTRLTLSTYGGPLPVFVERRTCELFGLTLDFTVEIGVQTSQGLQPMTGCCLEVR